MIAPAPHAANAAVKHEALVYEIVESAPLPIIDLSRSVRTSWLSKCVAHLWMRFLRCFRMPIMLGFYFAILLYLFVFFVVATIGRWMAVVIVATSLAGALTSLTMLRSDIVVLLCGSYEVCFISIVNALSSVLLAMYFRDIRAMAMLPFWLCMQSGIFLDANITSAQHFIISTCVSIVFLGGLIACVGCDLLDDAHSFVVFRSSQSRSMTVELALVNGWGTIIMLLCRNVHRRREALKTLGDESKFVQCISYRVKIKLVRVESRALDAVVPAPKPVPVAAQVKPTVSTLSFTRARVKTTTMPVAVLPVQMQLVKVREQFDASDTVVPIARLIPVGSDVPQWLRVGAHATAATGFSLMCVGLTAALTGVPLAVAVHGASLAATGAFMTFSLVLFQRQLARRMLFSFDFAFLSLQNISVHVCECDLLGWDVRCLPTLSSLLWIHWVLMLDTITPVAKQQWRIRISAAAGIMAVFLASQIVFGAKLVSSDTDSLAAVDFRDRSVLTVDIWGRTVRFRTALMLLGRLMTLLSWSCRMLWHIWKHRGDELIAMQGSVVCSMRLASATVHQIPPNAVVPPKTTHERHK